MIIGTINSQVLTIKKSTIAADTLNYLTAQFTFIGDEWEDVVKIAHFSNGVNSTDIQLTNDAILAENGLNLTAGKWKVSITGEKSENSVVVMRITTTIAEIVVLPSGISSGEPVPILPTYGEQVLAEVQDIKTDLNELQEEVETDKKEIVRFVINLHQPYEGGGVFLDTNNALAIKNIVAAADPENPYSLNNKIDLQVVFIDSSDNIAYVKNLGIIEVGNDKTSFIARGSFILGKFQPYSTLLQNCILELNIWGLGGIGGLAEAVIDVNGAAYNYSDGTYSGFQAEGRFH